MTSNMLHTLRKRIANAPANGRGYRQYDRALQRDVASYAAERRAQGESYAAIAKNLKLPNATLLNWRGKEVAQEASKKRPVGFRPVALQSSERSAPEDAEGRESAEIASGIPRGPDSQPVLVLPGGVRIEGMAVRELAGLIRSLGCLP